MSDQGKKRSTRRRSSKKAPSANSNRAAQALKVLGDSGTFFSERVASNATLGKIAGLSRGLHESTRPALLERMPFWIILFRDDSGRYLHETEKMLVKARTRKEALVTLIAHDPWMIRQLLRVTRRDWRDAGYAFTQLEQAFSPETEDDPEAYQEILQPYTAQLVEWLSENPPDKYFNIAKVDGLNTWVLAIDDE